jgi:cobalt-zinc-cadmium efflux system membrane fusion protein
MEGWKRGWRESIPPSIHRSILSIPPSLHLSILVLSILSAACRGARTAESAESPPAKPGEIVIDSASPKLAAFGVDTVRVTRERAIATLPAQLALDEGHTVRVFSPVAGRIRALLAEPGAFVAGGAPLASIASSDMSQATSDQVKADAAQTQANAALVRAEDLYAHKVIALKDLEQARSDAAQARAEADRARQRAAQLGASAGVQGEFVLRAPIGGTVIDRSANAGAEVRPDATTALFTVSSLDTLWLIASAPQRDLAKLHTGARLAFTTDAAPGRTFDARVTYVGDQLDPVTRTALVRASLPNPGRTLRAMTVGTARLLAPSGEARAVIPTRALITQGSSTVVFVETARGHYERRAVSVEDDDGTTATIAEGLKPGERVVTRGSILLAGEAARLP